MQDTSNLPFTLSIFKGLSPPPSVILRTPLVAELFGAGFTKAPHSHVSEPRIFTIKIKRIFAALRVAISTNYEDLPS